MADPEHNHANMLFIRPGTVMTADEDDSTKGEDKRRMAFT